jgi:hypothetical protein
VDDNIGTANCNHNGPGAGTSPGAGGGSGSGTSIPPGEDTPACNLGIVYKQCSSARIAGSKITLTEFQQDSSSTGMVPVTTIGSLDWPGDQSMLKTFHGGRVNKTGRTVNECMSSSFDPRNLQCVGCDTPHSIFNPLKPAVIMFSDQNFVPFLPGGSQNCAAVVRMENPSLSELADIATEILEKTPPSGTVLLFGSGSHLFRVGPSQYAADWLHLVNRCGQKWKGCIIGPLVPIVRNDCPGSIVRDIMILSAWLKNVYANSNTGLLDVWKKLATYATSHCEGTTSPEVHKLPLPTSISVGSVQTHTFVFHNSCPVILDGMNRKATEELLRTLIDTMNRDFQTCLNPEIIIANSWAGPDDSAEKMDEMIASQPNNHVILIGASNTKRLVPFLKAAGYTVCDLTQPGWLATPENIDFLIAKLNTIGTLPDTIVILELFGNSTFRYRQFDGTMALPFKVNNGYHMDGEEGVCDDETFKKLCGSVGVIFDACSESVKIIIPPLARHLYTSCCGNSRHCTNLKNEDHELSLLHATTHFRPLLKEALIKHGTDRFFVIDGIGAILGVPPGGNRGAPAEIVRELSDYCAKDGVHYTDAAYSNIAKTVMSAAEGVANGTLTKSGSDKHIPSGNQAGGSFFWRGFVSPIGARLTNIQQSHHSFSVDQQPPVRGSGHRGGRGQGHHLRGRGAGHHRPGQYYHPYWRK